MSFDLSSLKEAVAKHGRVTRIVVANVRGSAPREIGAAMLVWQNGQSGTIGGGALELNATKRADGQGDWLETIALGPALAQCCGGSVTLLAEVWDAKRLSGIDSHVVVRRVSGNAELPLKIRSELKNARGSGTPVQTRLVSGWMLEAVSRPTRQIWIYGAGHVGRAIVSVLQPLPDIAITWIDSAPARYPDQIDPTICQLTAENPADLVRYAPENAEHLILTYSHGFDLEICHRILQHGFAWAGLIGSATKWTRFRRKLLDLGHNDAQISRITCPIGQPAFGKHPQAIAIGVSGELLTATAATTELFETGMG